MTEFMAQNNVHAAELTSFLRTHGKEVKPGSDDEYTYIDQHGKKNWFMSPIAIPAFVKILERFRKNGIMHGISERQNGVARLFLDGDLKLLIDKQVTGNHNIYNNLLRVITPSILKNTVPDNETKTTVMYAFCESRSKTTYDNKTACYKDGLHIRFSAMFSQKYRKKIINQILNEKRYQTAFSSEKSSIKNIDSFMDAGSVTVPITEPGGSKMGGVPYQQVGIYRITYDHEFSDVNVDMLPDDEIANWNIVELFGPKFVDANDKITTTPTVSPLIERELEQMDQKIFEDMDTIEVQDISLMHLNDPQAREISQLLKLLARTRANDYKTWFTVMTCLASYGEKYKPIARMFSLQATTNYEEPAFETMWTKCRGSYKKYPGCCVALMHKMAKLDDPDSYKDLTTEFITETILKSVFEVMSFMDRMTAQLGDFHIAEIIYTAFPTKYVAVPKKTAAGQKMTDDSDVVYYTMITPKSPEYVQGSAYKYSQLMSMAPMNIYLSKKIPIILGQVKSYFLTKRDAPGVEEAQVKKFSLALGILGKAYNACMNHRTKNNIMRQFAFLVTDFQFERELDSAIYALGVYDAILETGVRPKLIQDVCEYKISRMSPSIYILFDPMENILIKTMQIYIDFVLLEKFDVILYILMCQCRALSRKQKKVFLLNLWGTGSNGKSTIIQFMSTALGKVEDGGYGYHMEMDYLVKERSNSSGAQSELMPLEHATYVTMSEPGENEHIIESKWKQLMSAESISARQLYGEQKNFVPLSVMMLGSNSAVQFKSGGKDRRRYKYDQGMLRRLGVVKAELEFKHQPDPDNQLHRKADDKIVTEYIVSPVYGGALLSIMSIVHSLYIMMHDERFGNVCSPNISKQTAEHVNTFDTIGRFISETCVIGDKIDGKLGEMIDRYISWHDQEYSSVKHDRDRIRNAFIGSKIEKNIKNREKVFWCIGVRSLAHGEEPAPNEKRWEVSNLYEFKSYTEFELPEGIKLPFDGQIKPTSDARNFLQQLDTLHKSELVKWDVINTHDVNYPQ
jgi:hypothetical protein